MNSNFWKKISILLPFVILIALPCSAKRELKLALDILPSTTKTIKKVEKEKICIDSFYQQDSSIEIVSKTIKTNYLDAVLFVGSYPLFFRHFLTDNVDILYNGRVQEDPPIFILHRKLII